MLHIYYGDGKGKTTSSVGLAIRMVGVGKKVQFIQFLKDGKSSENKVLKQLGIDVVTMDMGVRFVDVNNAESMKYAKDIQNKLFNSIDKSVDCLILDEILDVIILYMINEDLVYRFLKENKEKIEICITGRKASKKIVELSDYYTLIEKKKHPYDKGVFARKGVEF